MRVLSSYVSRGAAGALLAHIDGDDDLLGEIAARHGLAGESLTFVVASWASLFTTEKTSRALARSSTTRLRSPGRAHERRYLHRRGSCSSGLNSRSSTRRGGACPRQQEHRREPLRRGSRKSRQLPAQLRGPGRFERALVTLMAGPVAPGLRPGTTRSSRRSCGRRREPSSDVKSNRSPTPTSGRSPTFVAVVTMTMRSRSSTRSPSMPYAGS